MNVACLIMESYRLINMFSTTQLRASLHVVLSPKFNRRMPSSNARAHVGQLLSEEYNFNFKIEPLCTYLRHY